MSFSSLQYPLIVMECSSLLTWRSVLMQVFYAACQGLLYVLCYRLEHLMSALHPLHAATSGDGGGAQQAAVLQQMFSVAMPQLLHHRWARLLSGHSLERLLLQVPWGA